MEIWGLRGDFGGECRFSVWKETLGSGWRLWSWIENFGVNGYFWVAGNFWGGKRFCGMDGDTEVGGEIWGLDVDIGVVRGFWSWTVFRDWMETS